MQVVCISQKISNESFICSSAPTVIKYLTGTMDHSVQPQGEEGGDKLCKRGTVGQSFSQWA